MAGSSHAGTNALDPMYYTKMPCMSVFNIICSHIFDIYFSLF